MERDTATVADETALLAKWIEAEPGCPDPSNVRIKDYGYFVWALIADLGALGSLQALAAAFNIPLEAAEAALTYYHRHKEVIDSRIGVTVPLRDYTPEEIAAFLAEDRLTGEAQSVAERVGGSTEPPALP